MTKLRRESGINLTGVANGSNPTKNKTNKTINVEPDDGLKLSLSGH